MKAREYQGMPSVQRYVMLEQDSINAVVYARVGDAWTHEILVADSILALPEIEVELPLAKPTKGSSSRRSTSPTDVPPICWPLARFY